MRTTQQFSVTLPMDMANLVKAKVSGGEYATESEVIRDGLRILMARDRGKVGVRVLGQPAGKQWYGSCPHPHLPP